MFIKNQRFSRSDNFVFEGKNTFSVVSSIEVLDIVGQIVQRGTLSRLSIGLKFQMYETLYDIDVRTIKIITKT